MIYNLLCLGAGWVIGWCTGLILWRCEPARPPVPKYADLLEVASREIERLARKSNALEEALYEMPDAWGPGKYMTVSEFTAEVERRSLKAFKEPYRSVSIEARREGKP